MLLSFVAFTIRLIAYEMEYPPTKHLRTFLFAIVVGLAAIYGVRSQSTGSTQTLSPNRTTLNQFVRRIQEKAKTLETASGMRSGYEYTRRDVPNNFEIPAPLSDFFLEQVDKYGGASDATLQRLRYLREGVFVKQWTAEYAAREAVARRDLLKNAPAEEVAALQNFAPDMRTHVPQ